MNKVLKKAIQFLIFFAIGAFIFWLVYKDQDIERIKSVLKNDVNYFWIFISVIIGLLSHISRTVRWRIMIKPIGHRPSFINTFLAVMIGYLMNLAFPRMGEISRCGVMARYEKLSFTKLLGTVVSERVVDMIALLLLLLIVVISQFGKILEFLYKNPEIENRLLGIVSSPVLIIGILLFIIFVFIFRKTLKNTTLYKKVVAVLINLKYGIISIRSIEKKGWFLFHSVAIWGLYYLMLYVVFFAFDFTRNLPFVAGLTTFVLASFGMVAPVQGGIGTWHFMAIESLALYGVAKVNGVVFAFVAHGTMTAMIIILGIISLLVLPFANRRNNGKMDETLPETELTGVLK